MEKPLISIVIPTLNSEKYLPMCLSSISRQSFKNYEVIIVDSFSTDETLKIARKFKVNKILRTKGGLLWARFLGFVVSKGDIVILLDSDQVLCRKNLLEEITNVIESGYNMIILEESSYRPRKLIEWMYYFDRLYVHDILDIDPLTGVLLPRVFRRDVLLNAFVAIKNRLNMYTMMKLVSHDHQLIYYEAYMNTQHPKIYYIKQALYHIEVDSIKKVVKKYMRYGLTEYDLTVYYPELRKRNTPRKFSLSPAYIISISLWILKAVPYFLAKQLRKKY